MPSEANDTPTTMPIALLRAADALGDLSAGIDALMYLSVSGHFDGTAQSALGFIHRNLSDLLEDARERAETTVIDARRKAESIVADARRKAETIVTDAKERIGKKNAAEADVTVV